MRQLILRQDISIDGFVAGPSGEIDWLFESLHDDVTAWIVERLWQVGLHAMGSRTYHDMVAYWPKSTDPLAAPMNEIPKIVFSKRGIVDPHSAQPTRALADATRARPITASGSTWESPRVASGELAEEIGRLKAEGGKDIMVHGGASFARSVAASGLVDEYVLITHPVALGNGLPLFSGLPRPVALRLVSATPFAGGTVAHVYRP